MTHCAGLTQVHVIHRGISQGPGGRLLPQIFWPRPLAQNLNQKWELPSKINWAFMWTRKKCLSEEPLEFDILGQKWHTKVMISCELWINPDDTLSKLANTYYVYVDFNHLILSSAIFINTVQTSSYGTIWMLSKPLLPKSLWTGKIWIELWMWD